MLAVLTKEVQGLGVVQVNSLRHVDDIQLTLGGAVGSDRVPQVKAGQCRAVRGKAVAGIECMYGQGKEEQGVSGKLNSSEVDAQ